jgi:ubiquinone/menaquinone biosynthesis C-methylase UbiE
LPGNIGNATRLKWDGIFMTVYNKIGKGYSIHRQADPRIVESICRLLDIPDKCCVIDIGAGTGNYSNAIAERGHIVYAVEPSDEMRLQAIFHPNVTWVEGIAEDIPLEDGVADAVVAILSIHHFKSLKKASLEFNRICEKGTVVIFTFDPRKSVKIWLSDYFPSLFESAFSLFEPIDKIAASIASDKWRYEIYPFLLPSDLSDKFMAFGWKYPQLYLDATIRNSMSPFALADQAIVNAGIARLTNDLETERWNDKYGSIRSLNEIDLGYRFIKLTRKK